MFVCETDLKVTFPGKCSLPNHKENWAHMLEGLLSGPLVSAEVDRKSEGQRRVSLTLNYKYWFECKKLLSFKTLIHSSKSKSKSFFHLDMLKSCNSSVIYLKAFQVKSFKIGLSMLFFYMLLRVGTFVSFIILCLGSDTELVNTGNSNSFWLINIAQPD